MKHSSDNRQILYDCSMYLHMYVFHRPAARPLSGRGEGGVSKKVGRTLRMDTPKNFRVSLWSPLLVTFDFCLSVRRRRKIFNDFRRFTPKARANNVLLSNVRRRTLFYRNLHGKRPHSSKRTLPRLHEIRFSILTYYDSIFCAFYHISTPARLAQWGAC